MNRIDESIKNGTNTIYAETTNMDEIEYSDMKKGSFDNIILAPYLINNEIVSISPIWNGGRGKAVALPRVKKSSYVTMILVSQAISRVLSESRLMEQKMKGVEWRKWEQNHQGDSMPDVV